MWDLPGPGIEPVSLVLQGRFLTTKEAPPTPAFYCDLLFDKAALLIIDRFLKMFFSVLLIFNLNNLWDSKLEDDPMVIPTHVKIAFDKTENLQYEICSCLR